MDKSKFTAKDKAYLFERFDIEPLLSQLPFIKKEVTRSYLMNVKYVRRTLKTILDRKLTKNETKKFYKECFDMAIEQVGMDIRNQVGLDGTTMNELAKILDKPQLIQVMEQALKTRTKGDNNNKKAGSN